MKILRYKYNPNKKGVFRVSVVKNPAVGEGDLVLMAAQEIKGVFYAPVMIPDLKITRINNDTQEKYQVYYDAETVEQLANNYFRQCGNRNTNIEHENEDIDGVYPVESWIVKDPENDKSKALGMPTQKIGTWIMGYKADNTEVLEKVKNNLLQGLSIEGHLDAEEEVNVKFNKHKVMSKPLLEALTDLKAVIMSAISGEEKTDEKTADELAKEAEAKEVEMEEEVIAEPSESQKELAATQAENEELKKQVSDLEAELATYKNDAVLMSAELDTVKVAFESYKAVKMSAQKIGDQPKPVKDYDKMTPLERFRNGK